MAQIQEEDEGLVISFFPDPPPFYKHFTTENQKRVQDIEKGAGASDEDIKPTTARPFGPSLTADQILELPTELRYLIPPEPPAEDEEFNVFSEATKAKGTDVFMMTMENVGKSLAFDRVFDDWQYEQLYPSASDPISTSQPDSSSTAATLDRQNYLLRFIRSIMLSYISLLGIVASDATSPRKNEKLKDMLNMVANMHALINEYRPHQARETLILRMEEQVERKKSEIEGVRNMADTVRDVLEGFEQDAENIQRPDESKSTGSARLSSDQGKTQEFRRQMWSALDQLP